MTDSPCNNNTLVTYTPATKEGLFVGRIDEQFNFYGAYLNLGLTCADIRPDFDNNLTTWPVGQTFARPGFTLNRPTEATAIFTWPNIPGDILGDTNQYGFSIHVQENVLTGYDPSGFPVTVAVNRGNYDIGYIRGTPFCHGDGSGPYTNYHQVSQDNLTGTFPIVLGGPGTGGTTVGVLCYITGYAGPAPFTGSFTCAANTTIYSDNATGQINWPGTAPTMSWTYDAVSGFPDPDALFCCVTNGECCVTPPTGSIPKFLIPPPATPAPGEENATTPVLNQAIYLSNYTFQFVNNFGRVPKQ